MSFILTMFHVLTQDSIFIEKSLNFYCFFNSDSESIFQHVVFAFGMADFALCHDINFDLYSLQITHSFSKLF